MALPHMSFILAEILDFASKIVEITALSSRSRESFDYLPAS